jgi:hypothetical protein
VGPKKSTGSRNQESRKPTENWSVISIVSSLSSTASITGEPSNVTVVLPLGVLRVPTIVVVRICSYRTVKRVRGFNRGSTNREESRRTWEIRGYVAEREIRKAIYKTVSEGTASDSCNSKC